MRLALQKRIRDTSWVRTTVEEANQYLDDGYLDLAERTGIVVREITLDCAESQHFVSVPDNCLYPIAIKDVATDLPIDFVSWTILDRPCASTFIRDTAGRPAIIASVGLSELLVHPAYVNGGQIFMVYAAVPEPMTDSSIPEFPVQHHQSLVHYAHWRVLLKDAHGDLAGRRIGRAQKQFNAYLYLAGLANKWAMDRHGARAMVMGDESLRKGELQDLHSGALPW